jgi:hypothetical protein
MRREFERIVFVITRGFWQPMDGGKYIVSFDSKRTRRLILVAIIVAAVLFIISLYSSQPFKLNGYHYILLILSIVFFVGSYGFDIYETGIKVKHFGFYKWLDFEKIKKYEDRIGDISRFSLVIFDLNGKTLHLNFESAQQVQLFKKYLQTISDHGGNP